MRGGNKIKASALQFAILVSVIVALLLSSFLLFTYTYSNFSLRTDKVLHNIEASQKGIDYLVNSDDHLTDSLEIAIEDVPVVLKNNFWGGFQLVHSRGGAGSTSFEKVALLGTAGPGIGSLSIFLENNQLPLVLVGDTRIEGDIYTPENIIKPGSIAGHYYAGDKLVYGRRYHSAQNLPELDARWRFYAQNMLNFIPDGGEAVIRLENSTNSFFGNRQVIYQVDKIFLNESLSGNIVVVSRKEIEVSPFAKLDQVLLVAPKVIVRTGFEGNAHVISEEAVIEDKVRFHYPSSIVVFAKEGENRKPENSYKPTIQIGEHTLFEGNILYLNASEQEGRKNDLLLAKNSFIEGNVYCEGYTELEGTVKGSLYTKYFVANHRGSLYINHIYDGKVLTGNVKPEMGGLVLEGTEKKVAAWLY
ncbi:hypothetical protein LB467_16750 [Salegentibacter sp. JZCK2]|uniref:hypothetical protein n=1 Tax=Salegentibacter tibetensis TaxID=2873600 RepID=UPI001CCC15A9|nr:hypothetical protein [Salegentibacter tibetensis]MBZ9731340.1 hypothetical protein [Salegentibacter tibetensis]